MVILTRLLLIITLVFLFRNALAKGLLLEEIEVKAKKEAGVESLEVREVRETDAKDTVRHWR